MDVFEAIETRASVRSFKRGSIAKDELEKIIDAGRRAPSGYNTQPWEFIIVTDRDILAGLGEIQNCIAHADAAIAVVVDEKATKYWKEDASWAIENMLFAAGALGYASLWVEGYVLMNEAHGKEVLKVPADLRLLAILPIGKPERTPRQGSKKSLNEITYANRYGSPW
jgi:nitroreductase